MLIIHTHSNVPFRLMHLEPYTCCRSIALVVDLFVAHLVADAPALGLLVSGPSGSASLRAIYEFFKILYNPSFVLFETSIK